MFSKFLCCFSNEYSSIFIFAKERPFSAGQKMKIHVTTQYFSHLFLHSDSCGKNGREKPPSHILRNTQASTLRARSARVTGSVGERTWRGGKPGERSAHTERRGPRKLADTTAAACFHVDPVIDPKHSGLRGRARVRACRRRCAVQTAVVTSRAVGGACDPEVFSRCEPRSADLPERKAFFCPRIFCADR